MSDTDCARLLTRRRLFGNARRGQGCEFVQLQCGHGSNAYLTYEIPRGRVIEELSAEMWVKSNRGGLQMLLRVVLPNAVNPNDGQPIARLIPGTIYNTPGEWQRLSVEKPFGKLQSMLPSLRSQFGPDISTREAYVDLVVLNAYGGAGGTNVFLDDLQVHRLVSQPIVAVSHLSHRGERTAEGLSSHPGAKSRISLRGHLLTVEGQPIFVRAIEHRGESLESLKSLGFNAVQFSSTPTPAELREAERLNLWLICPPPHFLPGQQLDSRYDQVLAWNLGRRLGPRELESTRQLAVEVRRADARTQRPLICGLEHPIPGFSRCCDLLLLERSPLGGSFPLREWAPWLQRQQARWRMGVPAWATVPTQWPDDLQRQVAAFAPARAGPALAVDPHQIRALAFSALTGGARGLLFRSYSRLDAGDPSTQLRAKTLQLLNLELQLVEPWVSGGEFSTLQHDQTESQFGLWETQRARLVVSVRHADAQQYVLAVPDKAPLHFDLYGNPVTDQAFQVSSSGLRTLRQRRGAGTRITVDDAELTSLVVLTENPLVVNHLNRHVIDHRQQQAQLRYEITSLWLDLVEQVQQQLSSQSASGAEDEVRLGNARTQLMQCRRLLDSGDFQSAERMAWEAWRQLTTLRRSAWERSVSAFSSPVSSPLCLTYETLPLHWGLTHRLRVAQWSANRLAAGDFEDLPHLLRQGWSHTRFEAAGLGTAVELSLDQPKQGRRSLHLKAWPLESEGDRPALPPIVVTSAPVPVEPGALVRIQGWARIPQPIRGSSDGLLITDSLGGSHLALRIDAARDWQPFTLYRAVPDGERQVRISAALTGFGDVYLDGFQVSTLQPLPAQDKAHPTSTARPISGPRPVSGPLRTSGARVEGPSVGRGTATAR